MLKNEPLTKSEREDIGSVRELLRLEYPHAGAMLERAMEAEAHWREKIRDAPETTHVGIHDWETVCRFCDEVAEYVVSTGKDPSKHVVKHKPYCPWLLAQED